LQSPSDPDSEVKVALTWPEQILPEQPVTFGIRITDKSDTPVSAAAYELVLVDKLVFVVPTETMTKEVKDAIESMPDTSILQLRKYVTVQSYCMAEDRTQ
jgi:hypothetical protein